MEFSFKAKIALESGLTMEALEYYQKAAELENQVAEFYFDKPELEPTRSVIIRSAAFLNLKAGKIAEAKRFIFFGLLHFTDELIKNQLNNALELALTLDNNGTESTGQEFIYLNLLRQRSIHYILEPSTLEFGTSVSLEMIKDFSDSYLKSLKAYALSKFRRFNSYSEDMEESIESELSKIINPIVTNSAYGSFKFSIANDYLERIGESKDLLYLKANIVSNYHKEIFSNPLEDHDISEIKEEYSENEINEIFRPLTKIKASNSPYRIGYYDNENFNKVYSKRIVNKQKKKLLTVNRLSQEDIGELESQIVHKRSSESGKVTKRTLVRKQLKSGEFDIEFNTIFHSEKAPIILTEDIIVSVYFDSVNGFRFSFDDFKIENTDTQYERGLKKFQELLYNRIIYLVSKEDRNPDEESSWSYIKHLIGNIEKLKD